MRSFNLPFSFFSFALALLLGALSAMAETPGLFYVTTDGSDAADGMSWATAKQTIQAAIDASMAGDTVLVSNGVYATGGRAVHGAMTNRVVIDKAITVQSVNGPEVTSIQGAWDPLTTNGNAAVRCVYVTDGATLVGFTLTNGATRAQNYSTFPELIQQLRGGGALCEPTAVLSNCVIIGNTAKAYGGGTHGGVLNNCRVTGNVAVEWGGGAFSGTLNNCIITSNRGSQGGGAFSATLNDCLVADNVASARAGGVRLCTVNNSVLSGNSTSGEGGASYEGTLNNCILTNNTANQGGGSAFGTLNNCVIVNNSATNNGGGSFFSTLNNSILKANTATSGGGAGYSTLSNCEIAGNTASSGGGGVDESNLINCVLRGNTAGDGGGSVGGTLRNCLLVANTSSSTAGGAYQGTLDNCVLVGNSAGSFGGGILAGTMRNCIAYFNTGANGANYFATTIESSCTTPLPGGTGNIDSDPQFVSLAATNLRLSASSPCRDSGNNVYVVGTTDLDGRTRILNSTVDMGAYEFGPMNFHVATNGSDAADGTSWATAKQTIQAAIDASMAGDTVLVSNGVYATGGRVADLVLTNRVVIDKAITVQSVNGPEFTFIRGAKDPLTTNGNAAVRCVYIVAGATLSGFTLTNGATLSDVNLYDQTEGGGAKCQTSAVLSNCVLTGNSALRGGGAYNGTLYNCTITGNHAESEGGGVYQSGLLHCVLTGNSADYDGGGSFESALIGCTLTGNRASQGGGAYGGILVSCALADNYASFAGGGVLYGEVRNCTVIGNSAVNYGGGIVLSTTYNSIIYFNSAQIGANYFVSTIEFSCTTPLPAGSGNFTNDPQLASISRIASSSPCVGAGSEAFVYAADIDGEPWASPPSIGCDEFVAGASTGALHAHITAVITNATPGFPIPFQAFIDGIVANSVWQWGDGSSSLTNQPIATHSFSSNGVYAVTLTAYNDTYPGGVSATVTVTVADQQIHYVSGSNSAPASPYTSWATAATNIQDAIDAASQAGALVLVGNGIYETGGRVVDGAMTNRVVIDKPITVRSLNGPASTYIFGAGFIGDGAVRCVYLGANAVLSGFTLAYGATRNNYNLREGSGGGAWCAGSAVISNCFLIANSANYGGGGVHYGKLYNCVLFGNSAENGGGSYYSSLYNCTLVGNSASSEGGGSYDGSLYNCISYYNSGIGLTENYIDSLIEYSCTTPMPYSGTGNITNDPQFVDYSTLDLRLSASSPCRDSGNNTYVSGATDFDGQARIVNGTVDMGAYEFIPSLVVGPVTLTRPYGQIYKIAASALMTNASDAGGSPLTCTWVSSVSSNGHPVMLTNGWVYYQVPATSNETDYFNFRLANTNSLEGESTATILVNAPVTNAAGIASVVLTNGNTYFRWAGILGRTNAIEGATRLGPEPPANWSNIGNAVIGLMGYAEFTETNPPSPRYYRILETP